MTGVGTLARWLFPLARSPVGARLIGWAFASMHHFLPLNLLYETKRVLAFYHPSHSHKVHVLIVPKKLIARIADAKPEDHKLLGHLLLKAAEVAEKVGLKHGGYRLVINNGPNGGESVAHLHCHILGGRPMGWPPG